MTHYIYGNNNRYRVKPLFIYPYLTESIDGSLCVEYYPSRPQTSTREPEKLVTTIGTGPCLSKDLGKGRECT